MSISSKIIATLCFLCGSQIWANQEMHQVFQTRIFPDGNEIVFRWRGDLWKAPINGGAAMALTQAPSFETNPCISPDGSTIYYLSDRDDSFQIYSCDLATLETKKITSHSEGFYYVRQVFPDNKYLLVYAYRDATGFEAGRFYKVSIETGAEEMLFDDYGRGGSLSPDGTKLLFTREGNNPLRLHYQGSKATQLWLYDLEKKTFKKMFDCDYSTGEPLWHPNGRSFYYVDSRTGIGNIHLYDIKTGKNTAITHFTDSSVMGISISGNGKIITFNQMADTYVFDLTQEKIGPQKLKVHTDLIEPIPTTKRRNYQTLFNNDSHGSCCFSQKATELVFTTGGDLFVMDTILREPVAICNTTAMHEREAFFTNDGSAIFFLRDDGKSINIWKAERKDAQKAWWENREFNLIQITNDNESRYSLSLSPDGKSLVWIEDRGRMMISDLDGRHRRSLYQSPYQVGGYNWSPDGKWIVASFRDSDDNMDIWIVSTIAARKPFNLSRHPNFDYAPTWSPDGKIISFIGHRYDNSVKLYYVYLDKNNEQRGISYAERLKEAKEKYYKHVEGKAVSIKTSENGIKEVKKENVEVENTDVVIDFEDLETRIRSVDIKSNNPRNPFWSADGKSLAFAATINGKDATWKVTFPNKINQPELLFNEVGYAAQWLPDGRVAWCIKAVPAINNQLLNFNAFQETNLEDYQRLAFRLTWRGLRDNLYDPDMKNVDWDGVLSRYEDAAAKAIDLDAFEYLVNLSQSELNASHLGFYAFKPKRQSFNNWVVKTAHLGLLFDKEYRGEGLKVKSVVRNGPTDNMPNIVKAGDVLLSIDGILVNYQTNLIPLLTKEKSWNFKLKIKKVANNEEVELFVPLTEYAQIRNLRNQERLYNNKKLVDKLSGEKVGYLNIALMNQQSLHQFEHDVYATTFDRDALIIDVRNNAGGHISDFLLSMLCHPQHAITIPRKGERSYPYGYLGKSIYHKPLVVLCNQNTCSNAEIFSHAIKNLKRGKIIGVPSQACVISTPRTKILDIGEMATPDRGWWTINGIDMDLQGVIPDVIIWPLPEEIPTGVDLQLEKAVEVLLEEIAENAKKPEIKLIWAREGYKALPGKK